MTIGRVVIFGHGLVATAIRKALDDQGADVRQLHAPRLLLDPGTAAHDVAGRARAALDANQGLRQDLAHADVVINAAGLAEPGASASARLFGANALTPVVLALAATEAGVARFIQISSLAVVGDLSTVSDGSARSSHSPYAASKGLAEEALLQVTSQSRLVILRALSIHAPDRELTRRFLALVRKPWFVMTASGRSLSTLTTDGQLAQFVAHVVAYPGPVARQITQPPTGLTTFEVARLLRSRPPVRVPRAGPQALVAGLSVAGALSPRLHVLSRRASVMWLGQRIRAEWAAATGFRYDAPETAIRRLAHLANAEAPRKRAAVIATVPEQIRVQYPLHLNLLRSLGYHTDIFCSEPEGLDLPPQTTSHAVKISRTPSVTEMVRAAWSLRRTLKQLRPELVIYGSPAAAVVGAVAAFRVVPRRIFVVHGLREQTLHGLQRVATRGLGVAAEWLSTNVVFNSPSTLRAASRHGHRSARLLAGPGFVGVDRTRFRRRPPDEELAERLGLGRSGPVVGYVGRLAGDKGVDTLVQALSELEDDHPDIQLLLVGPLDETDPVAPSTHRALAEHPRIRHTQAVTDPAPYYSLMTCLALPSRREGLPTVILEAMATGTPVVATRATGIIDLVDDRNGWLVPVDDPRRLADALRSCLQQPRQASARAERAASQIARYDTEAVAAWWTDLYAAQQPPRAQGRQAW